MKKHYVLYLLFLLITPHLLLAQQSRELRGTVEILDEQGQRVGWADDVTVTMAGRAASFCNFPKALTAKKRTRPFALDVSLMSAFAALLSFRFPTVFAACACTSASL